MKPYSLLPGLLACLFAVPAAAADQACLFQGMMHDNGIRQVVHYCLSNQGVSAADFRTYCGELNAAHGAGATRAAASPTPMKYLASCPGTPRGRCDQAFGEKLALLYMGDDYTLKNGYAKLFCQSMDGKWK